MITFFENKCTGTILFVLSLSWKKVASSLIPNVTRDKDILLTLQMDFRRGGIILTPVIWENTLGYGSETGAHDFADSGDVQVWWYFFYPARLFFSLSPEELKQLFCSFSLLPRRYLTSAKREEETRTNVIENRSIFFLFYFFTSRRQEHNPRPPNPFLETSQKRKSSHLMWEMWAVKNEKGNFFFAGKHRVSNKKVCRNCAAN